MKNVKDLLNQQISQLAVDACRKMGKKETKKFFKDCPTVNRNYSNVVRKRKSKKRTVGKYKKSGMPKEVWEVDGKLFEDIWSRLHNYVRSAAYESLTRHSNELAHFTHAELDDLMSEIKVSMFKCLRFHGPTPNGKGFSRKIGVITANVLCNAYRKRNGVRPRKVVVNRKRKLYKKNFVEYPSLTSFSELKNRETSRTKRGEFEYDQIDTETMELLATVPSNLRKAVELLFGNGFKRDAAKVCGLKVYQLERELRSVFSELKEVA